MVGGLESRQKGARWAPKYLVPVDFRNPEMMQTFAVLDP